MTLALAALIAFILGALVAWLVAKANNAGLRADLRELESKQQALDTVVKSLSDKLTKMNEKITAVEKGSYPQVFSELKIQAR